MVLHQVPVKQSRRPPSLLAVRKSEVGQSMKLTDFLGRSYGPGDLVIYGAHSGRSINMVIGRVVDIAQKYYSHDTWKWERVTYPIDAALAAKMKDRDIKTSVTIQPLRASRWEQHHKRTYYTDSRSGKRINRDAPSGVHVLKESHYVHADGTEFDYEGEGDKYRAGQVGGWSNCTQPWDSEFRRRYHVNYEKTPGYHRYPLDERGAAKHQLWWVRRTYQPWVVEHTEEPKAVSIDITENIVKWEGELPDGPVPVQVP
jgi:hypothetical protein